VIVDRPRTRGEDLADFGIPFTLKYQCPLPHPYSVACRAVTPLWPSDVRPSIMLESPYGQYLTQKYARHQSVVLIGFAVTITPRVKLAPAQTNPADYL
jgi:hypothetical protein